MTIERVRVGPTRRSWPPMWARKHPRVVERAEQDVGLRLRVLSAQSRRDRDRIVRELSGTDAEGSS